MGKMGAVRLYFKFFTMHLKSQMQYKASFVFLLIGRFVTTAIEIMVIFVLFDRYNAVKGFTLEEVLLCASAILMAFSLAECIARGFDMFPSVVRNAEFDRIMVRPRNEIFLVLANRIDFNRFGGLITAAVTLIYAIRFGSIEWAADKIFTYVMMIISGTVVFSSLFLIYAGICFFTLEGLEFINIFTDGGRNFGQYPYVIYGNHILKFFTFAIPLALVQYYPLLYVLGKETNKFYMFTPFIAMLFIIPSYLFWRFGVRKYKSNGS
jgi:ABC-2 type transport system permease protein